MANRIEAQGVTVDEAIQLALNQLGVGRDSVEIRILHHPRSGFLGIGARRAKVSATVREDALQDGAEFDMAEGRRNRRRRRRPPRHRRDGETETSDSNELSDAPEGKTDAEKGDSRRSAGRETADREAGTAEQRSGTARPRGNRRGGRGRQGRGGRSEQSALPNEPNERASQNDRVASGQNPDRERNREQRGGRGRGRDQQRDGRQDGASSSDSGSKDAAPPANPSRSEASRQPTARTPRVDPPVRVNEPSRPAEVIVDPLPLSEISLRAGEIVTEMLRLMGFEAKVLAVCDDEADEVIVQIQADAEGLLIGRRGQTLDALEHLVNRSVAAREAAENRVVIDVGGYRDRRRESLLELAARLKERAVSEGRRVQVSPMSPRDRKVFQDAFGDDAEIATRALGTGFYRRVLIIPAGADEREAGGETEVVESSDTPQLGDQIE